jgi:hypothetical protein
VNCEPPGPIAVNVDQYRTAGGSWLRLALRSVAGSGDVANVQLANSDKVGVQCTLHSVWRLDFSFFHKGRWFVTAYKGATLVSRS